MLTSIIDTIFKKIESPVKKTVRKGEIFCVIKGYYRHSTIAIASMGAAFLIALAFALLNALEGTLGFTYGLYNLISEGLLKDLVISLNYSNPLQLLDGADYFPLQVAELFIFSFGQLTYGVFGTLLLYKSLFWIQGYSDFPRKELSKITNCAL